MDQGKVLMDDISNRCKNIRDRVDQLMANRDQRYQKVSNSYEKKYNLP
jgi:CHASE3 domain sensor protein